MTNALNPAFGSARDLWLTHDGVGLGPLRADLAETYWRWESSLRVMAGYGRLTPETLSERTAGLDSQMRRSDSHSRFTIYQHSGGTSDEWRPVGTASTACSLRPKVSCRPRRGLARVRAVDRQLDGRDRPRGSWPIGRSQGLELNPGIS